MKKNICVISAFILLSVTNFSFAKTDADLNDVAKDDIKGVEIEGALLVDGAMYQTDDQFKTQLNVRQAKLKFGFEVEENIKAKMSFKLDDQSDIKWDDYYLDVKFENKMHLKAGQFSLDYSLQNAASSKRRATMETASSINALMPKSNLGVSLEQTIKKINWSLGVFQVNESLEGKDTYAIATRAGYEIDQDFAKWHIGLNLALVNNGSQEYEVELDHPLGIDDLNLDTQAIRAKSVSHIDLELAMVKDFLRVQSELQLMKISADTEFNPINPDVDQNYQSAYLQMSYILGHNTKISYKQGQLGKFKTENWKFFEAFVVLDALNNTTNTDVYQYNAGLGVNYHYSENLRVITQLSSNTVNNGLNDEQSSLALGLRLSTNF